MQTEERQEPKSANRDPSRDVPNRIPLTCTLNDVLRSRTLPINQLGIPLAKQLDPPPPKHKRTIHDAQIGRMLASTVRRVVLDHVKEIVQ